MPACFLPLDWNILGASAQPGPWFCCLALWQHLTWLVDQLLSLVHIAVQCSCTSSLLQTHEWVPMTHQWVRSISPLYITAMPVCNFIIKFIYIGYQMNKITLQVTCVYNSHIQGDWWNFHIQSYRNSFSHQGSQEREHRSWIHRIWLRIGPRTRTQEPCSH